MIAEDTSDLAVGDLRIGRRVVGDALLLEWSGRSQELDPERSVGTFLREAVREAQASGHRLEMHFEVLEHFNSSTVTTLIQLIRFARARRVPVVIVFDESLKWQRLSFEALRVFQVADGLFEVRSADAREDEEPQRAGEGRGGDC
jgi:hypothetical protein